MEIINDIYFNQLYVYIYTAKIKLIFNSQPNVCQMHIKRLSNNHNHIIIIKRFIIQGARKAIVID